jgi:flagellar basal body-associated protein FliL
LEVSQWSLILAAVVVLAVNAAIYVRWSHKSSRTAQAR